MAEDLDGYIHAMKIEADSVRFMKMLQKKKRMKKPGKSLQIADEEKKHYNIVENIYEFVLKPKYFLAWGEFSNLKDFSRSRVEHIELPPRSCLHFVTIQRNLNCWQKILSSLNDSIGDPWLKIWIPITPRE
jgi:hypothetical protein